MIVGDMCQQKNISILQKWKKFFFTNASSTLSQADTAVMKAEAMLVKVLAVYNLPPSAVDIFTSDFKEKLLKFPDSIIAKKFHCSRSKSTAVLKEMSAVCK